MACSQGDVTRIPAPPAPQLSGAFPRAVCALEALLQWPHSTDSPALSHSPSPGGWSSALGHKSLGTAGRAGAAPSADLEPLLLKELRKGGRQKLSYTQGGKP